MIQQTASAPTVPTSNSAGIVSHQFRVAHCTTESPTVATRPRPTSRSVRLAPRHVFVTWASVNRRRSPSTARAPTTSAASGGHSTSVPTSTVRVSRHPRRVDQPITAPSAAQPTREVSSPSPATRNPTAQAATVPATRARNRCRTVIAAIGTTAAANSTDASGNRCPTRHNARVRSAITTASASSSAWSRPRRRGAGSEAPGGVTVEAFHGSPAVPAPALSPVTAAPAHARRVPRGPSRSPSPSSAGDGHRGTTTLPVRRPARRPTPGPRPGSGGPIRRARCARRGPRPGSGRRR